jgi:L-aspartate oxidase
MSTPHIVSDLIVVGSGIAGLSAAIGAAEEGLSVTVLSKADDPWYCNTYFAQGGIVGKGKKDSGDNLIRDILRAGDNLNWREAVDTLASDGPDLVDSLLIDKIKVKFSRDKKGELDLTKEAAHSVRRIYHDKDLTGRSIEEGLLRYVTQELSDRITIFSSMQALDLITTNHNSTDSQERYRPQRAIGLYVLNVITKEVINLYGANIIFATGGVGGVFQHSSNPSMASGDGLAMAYRAGAAIINAEFVQFHPTTLFHRDIKNFLISESLRGEGAFLVNRSGERFMSLYCPDQMELAPRDEVSRAIYREMDRNGTSCVFLDARHIDLDLKERFPGIWEKCQTIDIDISKDLIPVVPAAHYFCGGIKVNLDGYSTIPGLMAVGETACTGVHGANRLASVSLLEGLYFGYRAGKKSSSSGVIPSARLRQSIPEWIFPLREDVVDPILVKNDRDTIRALMWNYTGIIRNEKRLSRALSDLNYFSHRINNFYREARISRKLIELRNTVETATIITRAAISNSRSIGCHYVED